MLTRMAGLTLLTLGGMALPAPGQTVLQGKFKAGDTFAFTVQEDLKFTYDILGVKHTSAASATAVRRFTVLESHSDGTAVVRVQEKLDKLTATGPLAEPMRDYWKLMDGGTYTLTLGPRQEVSKLEGYEELLRQLAAKDPAKAQLLRQAKKGEENLRRDLEEELAFLPEKAVRPGDKWTKEAPLPFSGPMGEFARVTTYLYEGPSNGKERIRMEMALSYKPPAKGSGLLGLEILRGTLKTESAAGSILFDAAAGRLVQRDQSLRFKAVLTASSLGQEVDFALEIDRTVRSRLLEETRP
jgi:hypothetical protein